MVFSSCKSIRKIEEIQKHCLRIVLDDYESDYDTLQRKSGEVITEIKWLRNLTVEIFKTVNNHNQTIWKIYSHQNYTLR